jgi:hypothetical protein
MLGIGFIDGSMGAFPVACQPYFCSKNSSAARKELEAMVINFNQNEEADGMKKLNNLVSYADEITYNCIYTVISYSTINFVSENFEWNEIGLNILYNMGYMYTSIFNLFAYPESEVKNYSYFIAANIGDFLMRFLFRDKTLTGAA